VSWKQEGLPQLLLDLPVSRSGAALGLERYGAAIHGGYSFTSKLAGCKEEKICNKAN